MTDLPPLTAEGLLWAYRHGIFPMAESRHGPVRWYSPDPRAILPLRSTHFSRSLRKRVQRDDYRISRDGVFEQVMRCCAQPRRGDTQTWISERMIHSYTLLHDQGLAHSIEAHTRPADPRAEPELVGGLYGVALGGAFFGESMFSRTPDASKICLFHLVEHLRKCGYVLLDVQFNNPHMAQFGVIEIAHAEYMKRLALALQCEPRW